MHIYFILNSKATVEAKMLIKLKDWGKYIEFASPNLNIKKIGSTYTSRFSFHSIKKRNDGGCNKSNDIFHLL